jgi:hypothetical protein
MNPFAYSQSRRPLTDRGTGREETDGNYSKISDDANLELQGLR